MLIMLIYAQQRHNQCDVNGRYNNNEKICSHSLVSSLKKHVVILLVVWFCFERNTFKHEILRVEVFDSMIYLL